MEKVSEILEGLISLTFTRIEIYQSAINEEDTQYSHIYECLIEESRNFLSELSSINKGTINDTDMVAPLRPLYTQMQLLASGTVGAISHICEVCDHLMIDAYQYAIGTIKNHSVRYLLKSHLKEYSLSHKMMIAFHGRKEEARLTLVA